LRASLGPATLVFGWLQHLVANEPDHMPSMGPGVALAIGVINAVAGWFLFAPIHQSLVERSERTAAIERVARLPRLSAIWSFVLPTLVMMLPLAADFVTCPTCRAFYPRQNRGALDPHQRVATILFTDVEDFTLIAERLPADRLLRLLNEYFSVLVEIVERHGGIVTQIQGDALLVSYTYRSRTPGTR
jgi:hypothetical protein